MAANAFLASLTKQFSEFMEKPKPKTPAENVQHVLQVMEIIMQCNQHELSRHGHGSKEVKIDDTIQKAQLELKECLSSMRPHKWLGEAGRQQQPRDTSEMSDDERKAEEEREKADEEVRARVTKEELVKLHALSVQIAGAQMMELLVKHIGIIDFEAKKDVTALFRDLLKSPCPEGFTCDYVERNFDKIVVPLLEGYRLVEFSSFCCGQMLRECIKHQGLSRRILESAQIDELFTAVNLEQFDIATDAFYTLHDLLTTHKKMVAEFLVQKYSTFFAKYILLLASSNYVTRRQALKMLGDILLDRSNFNVMTMYISDVENLKQMMNLLRDRSKAIQTDAFQIFKVFVGNPHKTKSIVNILVKNQAKLVSFLQKLHIDDPQFQEDKAAVLHEIGKLVSVPDSPPTGRKVSVPEASAKADESKGPEEAAQPVPP
eukprot:CAMPEP_0206234986 /NCGR_PEP_ID=MMETSP0047_2-20121206/12897_1 /ASSEMBLY_ACC=CAM_ASM_000192 /TAXON_ID=195065 /ORGANISM="Chroomonas mesostigmatica_cf, Strain CCMP1168" /LENGTH=430 /DNA_ID=CAMNT_0053659137 /DNA_START=91 /DNA_END=1383 /DNA_ORIENTATION=+